MSSRVGPTVATPKWVGARVLRREDPRFLTGAGRFVDDVLPARTVHVAFWRSDEAHARITDVNVEAARSLPGVIAVLTGPELQALTEPVFATSRMADYHATEFVALARDRVRYVGEPVVAVAAVNRYVAEDAVELVEVALDPLPCVATPAEALDNETLLHEAAGTNVLATRAFTRGDPEREMASAPVVVTGLFRFHRKTPLAIENRSYLAEFDRGRASLTLHSSTQVPGLIRDSLAEILGLPGSRIRVVAPDVGGGFGGKASLYPEEVVVCALARKLGRPVKWTSDRREDLMSTSQAFDERVRATLGVAADGSLLALEADVVGDVGAYSIYPWTASLEPVQVVSFLPGPYRLEHYRGQVSAVATCKPPTGPYRGVGRPIAAFVMERLLDMAAETLGLDPRAIRAKNLVREEEFPYRAASGLMWDRTGFMTCLDAACDSFGYEQWRKRQAEARAEGRWLGIGIASYAELTGIGSRISAAPGMPINTGTETARLTLDATGAVTASFGVASHGQGLETSLAQIIADELGAPFDEIAIIHGDSAALPHGTGTYASRSAVLAGGAATLSSRTLRTQILAVASHLLEADSHDLDIADGVVTVQGTDRSVTFQRLAKAFYSEMGRLPKEVRETVRLDVSETYDPYFGTTAAATHIACVEIDRDTYGVKVLDYVVAEDCGRVINPLIVDGQVHGGVAQGIGAALLEEVTHDDTGQLLSGTLVDYLIPSAAEMPPMRVTHIESESPSTLGGYRGMGEGGTIGAPAAIANAVSDALSPLGVQVNEVPISPERIFQLLAAVEGK